MDKSPQAFRTISEVSDALEVPTHVLRFWEQKFPQIKPVKRGGGRRYYRPEDVTLLFGIRDFLYDDGMTIKGVQKIFKERGVDHVVHRGAVATGEAEPESESAADVDRDNLLSVIGKLEALRDRLRTDPLAPKEAAKK